VLLTDRNQAHARHSRVSSADGDTKATRCKLHCQFVNTAYILHKGNNDLRLEHISVYYNEIGGGASKYILGRSWLILNLELWTPFARVLLVGFFTRTTSCLARAEHVATCPLHDDKEATGKVTSRYVTDHSCTSPLTVTPRPRERKGAVMC
jgi:hypothetical protein